MRHDGRLLYEWSVETPGKWIRHSERDLGVAEREMPHQASAYHTIVFSDRVQRKSSSEATYVHKDGHCTIRTTLSGFSDCARIMMRDWEQ
jgi:hypothetical protein